MKNHIINTYNTIINAGILGLDSEMEKRRVRVVNIFLFISIWAVLSFGIMNYILDFPILILIDLGLAFILALGLVLNYYSKWKITKIIILYFIPAYFVIFPAFFGDIGTEYYNFVILILGFYILEKKRSLIFLSLFIIIVFLLSKYFIHSNLYPQKYKILEVVHYYPSVITSVIIIAYAISVFRYESNSYQKQLLTKQKELNSKVELLHERDLFNKDLIRELNHRVKNNLQLVSSLFSLQTHQSKSTKVTEELNEAKNRIDTIMILHQHLYQSNSSLQPNIYEYIDDLTAYIKYAFENSNKIDLELRVDDIQLSINTAVHIGLIINELLTNAFKYGINNSLNVNIIRVELKENGECINIRVKDNGNGFPQNINPKSKEFFGLSLVETISRQYDGTVEFKNNDGGEVIVKLCLQDSKSM